MEITFLGTGSAIPLPRHVDRFETSSLLHSCPQCQSKDPRNTRWPSSLLIDNHILVDAGPNISDLLESVNVRLDNIDTVFLTHRHSDASGGLPNLPSARHVFPNIPGMYKIANTPRYHK